MNALTVERLKAVLEETRDELTNMPKGALIYPMACNILASNEPMLKFICAKLNEQ